MCSLAGFLLQNRWRRANGAFLGVLAGYGLGWVTAGLAAGGLAGLDVEVGGTVIARADIGQPPPPGAPPGASGFSFLLSSPHREARRLPLRFLDPATGRRIRLAGPEKVASKRFRGHVDGVQGRFVHGWAIDTLAPHAAVGVDVAVAGVWAGHGLANRPRPDLVIHGRAQPLGFAVELEAAAPPGGAVAVTIHDTGERLPGAAPAYHPTPAQAFHRHVGLTVAGWQAEGDLGQLRLCSPWGPPVTPGPAFSVEAALAGGDIHAGIWAELPPAFLAGLEREGAATLHVRRDGRTLAAIPFGRLDLRLEWLRRFVVYGEARPDAIPDLTALLTDDLPTVLEQAGSGRADVFALMASFLELLLARERCEEAATIMAAVLAQAEDAALPYELLHPLGSLLGQLPRRQSGRIFQTFLNSPAARQATGTAKAAWLLCRVRQQGLEPLRPEIVGWLRNARFGHVAVAAMLPQVKALHELEADVGVFDALLREIFEGMTEFAHAG